MSTKYSTYLSGTETIKASPKTSMIH